MLKKSNTYEDARNVISAYEADFSSDAKKEILKFNKENSKNNFENTLAVVKKGTKNE